MSMAIIVVAAVIVSFGLMVIVKAPKVQLKSLEDLRVLACPIDLQAFEMLCDPLQDAYLRDALTPSDFARSRKYRNKLQRSYLRHIARNCALLMRAGELALEDDSTNPEGRQLIEIALRCRTRALAAIVLLHVGATFGLSIPETIGKYAGVKDQFLSFALARVPSSTAAYLETL
jgi:hypothetical protein